MLIIQDQVWNRVTLNRSEGRATRYYMDEFHLLLKEEQTAAYSVEIWKRFRKWGGIPTGITQNCKDLLASREVENIFEDICCKGWMSNPLLKQRDSQLIRSGLKRFSGKGGNLYRSGGVTAPVSVQWQLKRETAFTRKDVPPFPPATPESGARTVYHKLYRLSRCCVTTSKGFDTMRSILEEFAYGNITPNDQDFKRNSPFGEAMRALSSNEEKLLTRLGGEDKVIFEKYIDAQGEVNRLTAVKNLIYGYKLGLLMTAEAFLTSEDLIVGGEDY